MRFAIVAALLLLAVPAGAQEPPALCGPTGFSAERLGVVVNLTWEPVHGAEEYRIYRAPAGEEPQLVIRADGAQTQTIDTQVESGLDYTYVATAVVAGVELPSCGAVVVEAGGPCSPVPTAMPRGNDILLQWTALPVADAYHVYRASGDGELALLAVVDPSSQGLMDPDVRPGVTYTYEVRAVVDGQERPACAAVTATAIPFFPGSVAVAVPALALVAYFAVRRR